MAQNKKPNTPLDIDLKAIAEFDKALKSLGNMYDDEVRAREQLDEIQELQKQSMTEFSLKILNL